MSRISGNPLLRPTLSSGRTNLAPYRPRTSYLVSFFGGPVAAITMGALNAQRTGRLQNAAAWLFALLLSYFALEWWMVKTAGGAEASAWLTDKMGHEGQRLLFRALGLLYFAIVNWAFVREERTATLMGAARPNGTWIGIAVAIAGMLITGFTKQALS